MKHEDHLQKYSPSRILVLLTALTGLFLVGAGAVADTESENMMRADEFTILFRSARAVISKNQSHINNPDVGDKGLTGDVVSEQTRVNYKNATGREFVFADSDSRNGRAQQAFFDAVSSVMDSAASLINEQGKGFKGFLPAVFAKALADQFGENMDGEITIKLTAPQAYVRNRKNPLPCQ